MTQLSNHPPKVKDVIEKRYCPTDYGHWKVEGKRCPVCKARIHVARYLLVTADAEMDKGQ